EAARLEHPMRLLQSLDPVAPLREVIEGTQEQHRLHARVAFIEPPRIAQAATGQRGLRLTGRGGPRMLDVERRGIDERDAVAARGEPAGIDARAAAHVQNSAGRRRQVTQDDFLSAGELDRAVAAEETADFDAL